MNSASQDIATMLSTGGLGLTLATNLFIAKEPTKPLNTVAVYDGAGSPVGLTFTKGENYFYDAVQIRVRNVDYQVGYALALSIVTLLHGVGQITVNGTLYSAIYCSNSPAMLGWDDNGRCIFVSNFEVQRR
jgi:hypothetical protein